MKTLSEFLGESKEQLNESIEIINESRNKKLKVSSDDYKKIIRLKLGTRFKIKDKVYMVWFDRNNPYSTKTVALLNNPDADYNDENFDRVKDIKDFYDVESK